MIKQRKKYYFLSGLLVLASIVSLFMWQLNLGIDFTGGSSLQVQFEKQEITQEDIEGVLADLDLPESVVQPLGEAEFLLKMEEISEDKHQEIVSQLQKLDPKLKEEKFASIGPSIGQELQQKAWRAIILSLIAVIIYISWAFRKVSYPLPSWKYGVAAIVALFHDVLITMGLFSVLGHFLGFNIEVSFVAALLTIVGYSVNDTIVIFDRVRENIRKSVRENFEDLVDLSARQSVTRSINTSLTTLLVLFAVLVLGAQSITYFVLALMTGVALGTYSSLFVASPLVIEWEKRQEE
jgi:preprotein translocase subunit SecF